MCQLDKNGQGHTYVMVGNRKVEGVSPGYLSRTSYSPRIGIMYGRNSGNYSRGGY